VGSALRLMIETPRPDTHLSLTLRSPRRSEISRDQGSGALRWHVVHGWCEDQSAAGSNFVGQPSGPRTTATYRLFRVWGICATVAGFTLAPQIIPGHSPSPRSFRSSKVGSVLTARGDRPITWRLLRGSKQTPWISRLASGRPFQAPFSFPRNLTDRPRPMPGKKMTPLCRRPNQRG
jgi:hypothetical protein